jgi:hypothetical protein
MTPTKTSTTACTTTPGKLAELLEGLWPDDRSVHFRVQPDRRQRQEPFPTPDRRKTAPAPRD